METSERIKIAFVIYDGMTALDFVGVYDPITRLKKSGFLPRLRWEICGMTTPIFASTGLRFTPSRSGDTLESYDMIVVPGGFGSRKYMQDESFLDWLRTAAECRYKVSVCTGALLLGAAGFLAGKTATTHPTAFEDLRRFAAHVTDERVVDDGDVITSRGVTAGIDLGLYLCAKLAGPEAAERIGEQIDYPARETA
jgi:cyclohexyl-isocyanide hydratase